VRAANLPYTPAAAIERLKGLQTKYWMIDAEAAIERLGYLLGRTDILLLYRHYFPKAYRESHASPWCASPNGHSPRELEFFQLVSTRLFPIAEAVMDGIDERCDAIPLETAALDPEVIENWSVPWQMLFTFVEGGSGYGESIDWNAVQTWLPPGADLPAPVTSRRGYDVNWKRFLRRAARLHPRLKHLRVALQVAGFSTGNNFLDVPYDMLYNSEMPEWTAENVDWLAKEWRRAQPIIKQANAVTRWLEARPKRLADLIALFNACVTFKPDQEVPA
jgi:hypothetical protein